MWSRPVPLIGDASSAGDRAADPTGWAFPVDDRDALHRVIGARRDIRRYRPDPVPSDVLRRVLSAAHAAPSVGHSQPWRFVVVRDADRRQRASMLADRERLAQAAQLDPESARRLLDLQLEGIREAPLGVVVCCDRRTPAVGVLGRATFPDADLWSCACAIQNLWLAARAEGLGVGWVTLFQPDELADLLHLPDGVVTLGWLCVGWPDERPPGPGLERAGWSRRMPLADVVLDEHWPHPGPGLTGQPAPPPSHLQAPDQRAVVGVRDLNDRLLTPPNSLGVLDRALDRIRALGLTELRGGTLVLAAADHPVTRFGVSAYPVTVTGQVVRAAVAGQAMGSSAAAAAGLSVVVVDAGVAGSGGRVTNGAEDAAGLASIAGTVAARPRGPVGDLVLTDGLTSGDVHALVEAGRRIGASAAASGVVVLGEVGVGNTTVASALAAALLGLDATATVGLGAGADSDMVARKTAVCAGCAWPGPDLATGRRSWSRSSRCGRSGAVKMAVLTGVAVGAAAAGAVVVLDGLATSVAALAATRLEPAVAAHLLAGHRSREAGHQAVLVELGQEPLLDLRIRAGEGVGGCLAVALLRTALASRDGTATTG